MRAMRWPRMLVVVAVAAKLAGLGAWWWTAEAAARSAPSAPPSGAESALEHDESASLMAKSRGFREMLEAVRGRAQELDRRENELKAREAGLQALRRSVAAETTRLEGLAKQLGADPSSPRAAGIAITKVYESMRPEEAAPILDRLDDATLRALLGRMREKQVGAILAAMNRDRSAAFTKALVPAAVPGPASDVARP